MTQPTVVSVKNDATTKFFISTINTPTYQRLQYVYIPVVLCRTLPSFKITNDHNMYTIYISYCTIQVHVGLVLRCCETSLLFVKLVGMVKVM